MKKTPKKILADKIGLVAGATRGAGRGIAIALGEAGATVYCTGRSSRKQSSESAPTPGRPETIEETAELVTAAGGRGIAVRVSHQARRSGNTRCTNQAAAQRARHSGQRRLGW